ncbi:GNAT family N-acetyltransferase [Blastomonas sp. RAC04]|uniref:GNAT family N-acetyltransferase n=1 Tax=Blastomonas sp. RAC04 TaxID=1842535 RepID=UPI001C0B8FF6|nr:GNAT family N-acetyltransferase [Blastomonas sp. RAC04]
MNHQIAGDMEGVSGPSLKLRLVEPDDAGYIQDLRMQPRYNRHLSPVTGDVEDQRNWILRYKQAEQRREQLYYVIERHDGCRCGLVRLYDITPMAFTWGSWILDENKPPKAALESAMLSFYIGFGLLALPMALVDVRIENERAASLYRGFGMEETGVDEENIYFHNHRDVFLGRLPEYVKLLEANSR